MDPTSLFPGSWGLVKRNLPGLVGAGLGSIAGAFVAGRKAYRQIQSDSRRSRFVTWREPNMSVPRAPVLRVGRRRFPYRRRYVRHNKGMVPNNIRRIVRSSALSSQTIAAGTSTQNSTSITLNQVQTSDLTGIYRLFRLRKAVVHIVPRVDPANSGLANNYQCIIAAACDPETTAAPANFQAVTAYDNSYQKFVTSGDRFKYTFYPKVTNTVDNGGATAAGSYAMNPWLRLDATGIQIPHLALKLCFQTSAATTINFDVFYDLHFDVRGIA